MPKNKQPIKYVRHMRPDELQSIRHSTKLTQEQLGALVHAAGRTVQDWELGRRTMPRSASELLCIALMARKHYNPKFLDFVRPEISVVMGLPQWMLGLTPTHSNNILQL